MERTEEKSDGTGLEVLFPEEGKTAPCCAHGPTLLFEKVGSGGARGRRFYACSACRDRKDCSFFQWEDEKVSEASVLAREAEIQSKRPRFTQEEYRIRFLTFAALPLDERKFCEECQVLVLPAEHSAHSAHRTRTVSAAQLRRPSLLLSPLGNKKSNAQYLFSERSACFLLDALASLGYRKVLCVGTPRLQELIKQRNLQQNQEPMQSLLLDIDYRYAQFYAQDQFCHYNMFNHHFFGGQASRTVLENFLEEVPGQKVVMVADPPFGGLVRPLANSFSLISQMWRRRRRQEPGDSEADLPLVWIFPYFFEPRILECLPSLAMLDYQVDYDNHPLYKHGKTGRRQSPVRIFTNIPAQDVVLPAEEGYRFCSLCQRYVSSLNKHCSACNLCPSKDGRQWKHCSACSRCVKPSWRHCLACSRCALPDHPCRSAGGRGGAAEDGCFSCGSLQHKQNACPLRARPRSSSSGPRARRRSQKASRHAAPPVAQSRGARPL
ncbi:rRNA N6-adenosine-methyltransferase ZCCHC4 [Cyprinodon tularosa]|uniref:rRNA N6-adenosine-methyltransferase ZCCHC4 n=1 Tax=Cyprinodon tularosa TaxID=77115 RepID=UPI0018E25C0A|nr:rRNA N6-adenosine-methyltransferase ZCCHC4 [Cyprinodon tularosa]